MDYTPSSTNKQKKRRIWPYVLLGVVVFIAIALFAAYRFFSNALHTENLVQNSFLQNRIVDYIGEDYRSVVEQAPLLLGFQEPKTYLLLFLNNTEMRPGGGFIGSYATIRITEGQVEVLAFEGTETLDGQAPKDWRVEPPAMISNQLKVDRWYFRDSNWDPDFAASAKRAIEFYRAEGGVAANDIDMVVGVTPTVLEELMEEIGPISLQGITFTADNVVETLEYEVEYGFADRNISFEQRKQIMLPFFHAILDKVTPDAFAHPQKYLSLLEHLIEEKHIIAFSPQENLENLIVQYGAQGTIPTVDHDYLLWVDANLAALKTDHAMERELDYRIERQENGTWQARAKMRYTNTGTFDWRTTRYRTFARVYVPQGARLTEVIESGPKINPGVSIPLEQVSQGQEFGKQWFGHFMVIEPGDSEILEFVYELPAHVFNKDAYQLLVQKQLGLDHMTLTLDIDFDKNVQGAAPAEASEFWGDDRYQFTTAVTTDKQFSVEF